MCLIGMLVALLQPTGPFNAEPSRPVQCKNHLKQIGLALYYYHDAFECFPPAYTLNEDGERLHSWRSLILPYLEQSELYESIDFTKPWDHPNNAAVAKETPYAYRCPSAAIAESHTMYLTIVDPGSCFPGSESISISDISDGPDATLLLLEVASQDSVPWMSPQDANRRYWIDIQQTRETPHLEGTQIMTGDGSVRFLTDTISKSARHALVTIAGGEKSTEY